MNKMNLLVDGNYLLNKTLFPLHSSGKLYTNLHAYLIQSCEKYATMHCFDNMYFISDLGTPWRKRLFDEYKGTRKKDSSIDWDFIKYTYNEVKEELLKKTKYKVLGIDGVEGDDLIHRIIQESNNKSISCLLMSDDGDMKQDIKAAWTEKQKYTNIMFNDKYNHNVIYHPENMRFFLSKLLSETGEYDIFDEGEDLTYVIHTFIRNFLNKADKRESINSTECLLVKMMSGDVGDNIPSVYYSDKKRALRDAGARKLIDIYKEKIDSDLTITPKLMEYMAQIICDSKKIPLEDEKTYKSIINAFERNNKLINLTEIPQDILDKIDEKIKDII